MATRRPLLLLTRPQGASEAFRRDLPGWIHRAVDVFINPLLSIHVTGPIPPLDRSTGLIFTSANGLDAYRALGGRRMDVPVIAVGEGTADAARAFGFEVDVAGGNAERLVQHILDRKYPGPFVHLRGESAIGDIAARLTALGVTTREAVLYRQKLQTLGADCREALSQDRPVIAPVFSARTARQLVSESRDLCAPVFAAISPAVAGVLPSGAKVRVAQAPTRAAMVALVTGLVAESIAVEPPLDGL